MFLSECEKSEVRQMIEAYLKENLKVYMDTRRVPYEDTTVIEVELRLGEETIYQDSVYL